MKVIIRLSDSSKKDVELNINQYDNETTILEKYVQVLNNINTNVSKIPIELGEYYIIQPAKENETIKDGSIIIIEDIRSILKKMPVSSLINSDSLLKVYFNIPQVMHIGVLWLSVHSKLGPLQYDSQSYTEQLRSIAFSEFITSEVSRTTFEKYFNSQTGYVAKKKILVEKKLTTQVTFDLVLNNINTTKKAIPTAPFVLESVSNLISLALPNGEELINIFDSMEVSIDVPFIMFYRLDRNGNDRSIFKVLKNINIPSEWIEEKPIDVRNPVEEGIYFKVLSVPREKLYSSNVLSASSKITQVYGDGKWLKNSTIQLDIAITAENTVEECTKKVFATLDSPLRISRVQYIITSQKQISIKGKFSLINYEINRPLFADFIMNNPAGNFFMFFSEITKTVLSKEDFHVYYQPDQKGNPSNALKLLFTPRIDNFKNKTIDIRVSRAKNIQQIESLRIVIGLLLGLYEKEQANIEKIYSELVDGFSIFLKTVVKQKEKKEKITGKRLDMLIAKRPELFPRSIYAGKCQQKKQPLLVTEQEAKTHDTSKYINFPLGSNDWYICEPREKTDESDEYIYPGLQTIMVNNKSVYVPCCFKVDQHQKKGDLTKYLSLQNNASVNIEEKFNQQNYILGQNKLVPEDRLGELPYNLGIITDELGIQKYTRGKQTTSSLLRLGVKRSSSSILHCMEKVFNQEYSFLSSDKKEETILKLRNSFVKSNFVYCSQELFNYSEGEIKEVLKNPDIFFDGDLFVSLLELYYKCRIFVFEISDEFPKGNIVIPNFSQVYLNRPLTESDKSRVIVLFKTRDKTFENLSYPYQYEILVNVLKFEEEKYFVQKDFLKEILKLFNDASLTIQLN